MAAPAQIDVGQLAASLVLATATGAGTAFMLPIKYGSNSTTITWQVTFKTAAPGAMTLNLEGSIDGTNWYTLDQSTNLSYTSDTVSGEIRFVANRPVRFVRANLAAYTQGGNAGVSVSLMATAN